MIKCSQYEQVQRLDLARTIFGKGRYWTTAYLIDGLLVDSGCAHTAHELGEWLGNQVLHTIVNTHSHEDHIGGNGPLRRLRSNVQIFSHPLALEVLGNPKEKQPLQLYRKLFWGCPEPSQANPIAEDALISTENHSFKVIYTPGHSLDHLCLYEPTEGWLFAGDLFVGGKDRAIRVGSDIWGIIDSLKRVAELPLTCMFPGSARVRQEPLKVLREKIAYLEELGEQILDLHEKGWDVRKIASRICGGAMFIELMTLGQFSRRELILSYITGRRKA